MNKHDDADSEIGSDIMSVSDIHTITGVEEMAMMMMMMTQGETSSLTSDNSRNKNSNNKTDVYSSHKLGQEQDVQQQQHPQVRPHDDDDDDDLLQDDIITMEGGTMSTTGRDADRYAVSLGQAQHCHDDNPRITADVSYIQLSKPAATMGSTGGPSMQFNNWNDRQPDDGMKNSFMVSPFANTQASNNNNNNNGKAGNGGDGAAATGFWGRVSSSFRSSGGKISNVTDNTSNNGSTPSPPLLLPTVGTAPTFTDDDDVARPLFRLPGTVPASTDVEGGVDVVRPVFCLPDERPVIENKTGQIPLPPALIVLGTAAQPDLAKVPNSTLVAQTPGAESSGGDAPPSIWKQRLFGVRADRLVVVLLLILLVAMAVIIGAIVISHPKNKSANNTSNASSLTNSANTGRGQDTGITLTRTPTAVAIVASPDHASSAPVSSPASSVKPTKTSTPTISNATTSPTTTSPAATPPATTLPATTLPATTSPTTTLCNVTDDLKVTFPNGNSSVNCSWLASKPSQKGRLCKQGKLAFVFCPKTCGNCNASVGLPWPKQCGNDSAIETFGAGQGMGQGNCAWLSTFPKFQDKLCVQGSEAYQLCRETCRNCGPVNRNATFVLKLPFAAPHATAPTAPPVILPLSLNTSTPAPTMTKIKASKSPTAVPTVTGTNATKMPTSFPIATKTNATKMPTSFPTATKTNASKSPTSVPTLTKTTASKSPNPVLTGKNKTATKSPTSGPTAATIKATKSPTPRRTGRPVNAATPVPTNTQTILAPTATRSGPPTSMGFTALPTSVSWNSGSLKSLFVRLFPNASSSLKKQSSAQSKALQWLSTALSNGDYTPNKSTKRIVQLWSLATFAYSTGFENQWLSGNECSWAGVSCNDGFTVSAIDLSNSGLTGQFPPELFLLTELVTLIVSSNSMTGSIPNSLGSLSKLQDFRMDLNQFTGAIPSTIGGMSSLRIWYLKQNPHISGQFPVAVTQLQNLADLELDNTNITGVMPSGVCHIASLTTLVLDCHKVQSKCWTQCIYNCGGNTGVACGQ